MNDNTIGSVKIITRTYLDSDVWEGSVDYRTTREQSWSAETVGEAVQILRSEDLTSFSDSDFRTSGWFMAPNTSYVSDHGTGENTEITGHLEGFSPEAALAVYGFIVNGWDVSDDDDDDDDMTWSEAYSKFDDHLNEIHGTVTLLGSEYDVARVIREVDPTAYQSTFVDWADHEGIDMNSLIGPDPYP